MSLLKITNKKLPLNITSKVLSEGYCNGTTTVKFTIPSSNATEVIKFGGSVGGDDNAAGSFDLTVDGEGTRLIHQGYNNRQQESSDMITVPTNKPLTLHIEATAPTSRVNSKGQNYVVSTSCTQDSQHTLNLSSSVHVNLVSETLDLNVTYIATDQVWANDGEDGLGGGLIP